MFVGQHVLHLEKGSSKHPGLIVFSSVVKDVGHLVGLTFVHTFESTREGGQ